MKSLPILQISRFAPRRTPNFLCPEWMTNLRLSLYALLMPIDQILRQRGNVYVADTGNNRIRKITVLK